MATSSGGTVEDGALPPSEAVMRVVQKSADGVSTLCAVPQVSAELMETLRDEARRRAVTLIEVASDPDARAFSMGAVTDALAEFDTSLEDTFIAADAPPRLLGWAAARVETHLRATAAQRPVVLVAGAKHADAAFSTWLRGDHIEGVGRVVVGSPAWPAPSAVTEPRDEEELLLTQVLALNPTGLRVEDLTDLTGLDVARTTALLERLRAAGWLSRLRGHLTLTTSDLRARAVSSVPGPLQAGLRRDSAELLARRATAVPAAELALGAAQPGDDWAVDALIAAMDEVAASDPEAAADFGNGAVALLSGTSDLLTTTAWRLLPLLWRTSRVQEAKALATRVFTEQGQAEAEAQVLLWMSRLEPAPERARRLTASALAIPGVSDAVRARLYSVHMRCLSTLGLVEEVDLLLPQAIAVAVAAGEDESISRLMACDAIRHFYRGRYNTAAQLTARAEEFWAKGGARPEQWLPEMIWAPHLRSVLGEPDEALEMLGSRLAALPGNSDALVGPLVHAERSQVQLIAGRLAEANDDVVAATYGIQRLWGDHPGVNDRLQAISLAVRIKIALHKGDMTELAELRETLDATEARPGSEAALRRDWWSFLIDDAGLPTSSTRVIDVATLSPVSWLDPADEVLIVRALLSRARREVADRHRARATERAELPDAHSLAITLHAHLDGLVQWTLEPLERAAQGWGDLGRPLLQAAAWSDLGMKMIDDGDVDEGLTFATRAHLQLTELGALHDAWRIRWALRAKGHLLSPQRDRTLDLTPTERRVVERAITGITVNEIASHLSLSRHTVSTHLRHVYDKLDISSRAELVEWARST